MIDILKKHSFFQGKHIEGCELLQEQGYCNENYLLVADGVKYIVRKLLRSEIDRTLEWKILTLAYEEGITAEPILYDAMQGVMVFSFLEGKHQTTLTEKDVKNLVKTLKKLHRISVKSEPISVDIQKQSKKILQAFDTIASYPKEHVLCHNDLNPKNIFFSHEAKLIDFEYAGINDRYFDLACICVEFGFDVGQQEVFLELYFEGVYSLEKLEAYKIIYVQLYNEWFLNIQ